MEPVRTFFYQCPWHRWSILYRWQWHRLSFLSLLGYCLVLTMLLTLETYLMGIIDSASPVFLTTMKHFRLSQLFPVSLTLAGISLWCHQQYCWCRPRRCHWKKVRHQNFEHLGGFSKLIQNDGNMINRARGETDPWTNSSVKKYRDTIPINLFIGTSWQVTYMYIYCMLYNVHIFTFNIMECRGS
jgi:hypothetical protein